MPNAPLDKSDFEKLSEFRHQVRRFLRFSEDLCRSNKVTPLQYLMLLHIKGYPDREWATIGEIADRLQAAHHGVVALVTRAEKIGLVRREPSKQDRRVVEIHLTDAGQEMVRRIATRHRDELVKLQGTFTVPTEASFVSLRPSLPEKV